MAIGAVVGGAGGATYVMGHRGIEVVIRRGTPLMVTLVDAITVRVEPRPEAHSASST
jgi:hypothetical protein